MTSPLAVTVAVLIVFLLSPMILIGNSLLLITLYRLKRLRTPSSSLFMSLALSDLGIGMFMPVGMYFEVGGMPNFISIRVCLFSYGIAISLCCVSVLVMVAIAVDRFTSLAAPLRYRDLITHTAVERYLLIFWVYSSIVGFTPLVNSMVNGEDQHIHICSFGSLVAKPIQLFMFFAVYGPSVVVLLACYGYIYVVARQHAKAIRIEARRSIQSSEQLENNGRTLRRSRRTPRYGLALAITTGSFLILWMPFLLCMLTDVIFGTNILTAWLSVYLALPILASSAFNPWVYGYRNSELRSSVRKVIDEFLGVFGFNHRSQYRNSNQMVHSAVATAGDANSFINSEQKEPVDRKQDHLLVPMVSFDSLGVVSDCGQLGNNRPTSMKGSKSMVECMAVYRSKGVLILSKKQTGMKHGISIV
ncbi:adenosine receptor A2b-like [Diorhabda sublineata]|uniref:adenosine receptor A2b-like n=1 Tax=Diorhabda sublineata TaxID=1163346 RepID=UPI0024E0F4BA|nr:adenosine receptor A2b-like [Diorhabda sublineata]